MAAAKFDTELQANTAASLALGRILNLGSRPEQAGDSEKYEDARTVFLDAMEYLGIEVAINEPCYQRDYHKFLLKD